MDIDTIGKTYYEAMHWDLDTGKPDRSHLKKLGIEDVIEVLHDII